MSNIEFAVRTLLGLMPRTFEIEVRAELEAVTDTHKGVLVTLKQDGAKDSLWFEWYALADWKHAIEQVMVGGAVEEPEYAENETPYQPE